jgi:hypothetical protein
LVNRLALSVCHGRPQNVCLGSINCLADPIMLQRMSLLLADSVAKRFLALEQRTIFRD